MRIGIITHYYKNTNYGGNLQAYALCKILNEIGHEVEQISIDHRAKKALREQVTQPISVILVKVFKVIQRKIKKLFVRKKAYQINIGDMWSSFEYFNLNVIPHSEIIYSVSSIRKCISNYDAFITGSDQVWNVDWYFSPFFLEFVPKSKIKISYAASLGKCNLNNSQKKIFKKNLATFDAVSVREEGNVKLLQSLSDVEVECHLDPTLLLSQKEWDKICSERVVEEAYMFCYFLGGASIQRNIAIQYAEKNKLKIVTLPYLLEEYRECDEKFGDIKLYNIGPEKWISLIKYSNIIFTDSFHACVFAGIYEKQYIVFERDGHEGMGNRIYNLLNLYQAEERFCDQDGKINLEYIEGLDSIDYMRELNKLNNMKVNSKEYLERNLVNRN